MANPSDQSVALAEPIASQNTESGGSRSMQRADFVLAPYVRSNNLWATWQIANTLVPYALLWYLLVQAAQFSPWLVPPLLVLTVLFSGRCFSLMHDCGHQSLFRSKAVNRGVGFLLGVVNAIPQYPWSRGHAFHHKHNGNWDLYRGPSALVSSETFLAMGSFQQGFYQFIRHPLMLFPGGFFYLVIKPRLALLLGSVDFAAHAIRCWRSDLGIGFKQIRSTYKPKYWYTDLEFQDLLLNNICVVGSWILLSQLIGTALFWTLYSIVMACSAALFICIFFVQHNFEGSYAHRTEGWSSLTGAIEGTSLLKLPAIFNWFTADIGYHNIHHLCSRIPNYHLQACHQRNAALLSSATTLTVRQIPECFKFILWDRATDSLQSVAQVQQAAQAAGA
ncbi:fatty acid desaturase [Synechococcus sp. CS-1325]|uniref:fatty acid desaturase n=1 Tax=Synechococcus sp. CS-1325 TaxID=2847979 RepID=UPI00223B0AB7|nr:fatty acid desaturase [Synechococcus sp. CS-1325]